MNTRINGVELKQVILQDERAGARKGPRTRNCVRTEWPASRHFFALIASPDRAQIIPHVAHARARVLLTKLVRTCTSPRDKPESF
jgi:hypothetical protein